MGFEWKQKVIERERTIREIKKRLRMASRDDLFVNPAVYEIRFECKLDPPKATGITQGSPVLLIGNGAGYHILLEDSEVGFLSGDAATDLDNVIKDQSTVSERVALGQICVDPDEFGFTQLKLAPLVNDSN